MVEESSDEDTIRMDIAGTEVLTLTNSAMTLKGTTPTLTIGDAGAEDTKIVFDGNAQDYYIGLDDSADDLIIGKGSTVGTTPAIAINENEDVCINGSSFALAGGASSYGNVTINGASGGILEFANDGTLQTFIQSVDTSLQIMHQPSTPILFGTNNAERMRIAGDALKAAIGSTDMTSGGGFAPTLVLDGSAFTAMIVKSTSGTQEGVIANLGDAGLRFDVAGSATASNNKILFQTGTTNSNFNTTLRMCISSNGSIGTTDGGTNIFNASDARLKQNINSLSDSLNIINNLNPVSFNWVDNFSESEKDKTLYGFIAQEVQDVFPDAIEDFSAGDDIELNGETIENPLTVREKFIIPVLVKAMQEQQDIIDNLKTRIETLEGA